MWIEMIMHMSGTRANGEKYPPGFTPFEVDDWEGEHLIRGGMAREVAAPQASQETAGDGRDWGGSRSPKRSVTVPPAAPAPPAPVSQPSATAAGPAQEAPAPVGTPPAPSDPKQAWIDYAVAQGMDADAASRMTKADLQSRYGPRL